MPAKSRCVCAKQPARIRDVAAKSLQEYATQLQKACKKLTKRLQKAASCAQNSLQKPAIRSQWHATELAIWCVVRHVDAPSSSVLYNKKTTKKGSLCVALLHIPELKKQARIC